MKKITLIDKTFLLKRTPLFYTLDLDLLLAIGDKLGIVMFEPGESIFNINEEGHRIYFIHKGEIEIRNKDKQICSTLAPGDYFGEEALFNDKPRAYEAISKTESQLLTLSRTNLLTIISECPSVALGLLQVYTGQFPVRFIKPGDAL